MFKALNTLTVRVHALIQRHSTPQKKLKFLPLLSDISASYFSLFQLVFNIVVSDARLQRCFELHSEVTSKNFPVHREASPSHPNHFFSAFTIQTFLEPRIFSLLTDSFYLLTSFFDKGPKTPTKILKILLDCKFTLKQFYSFYLSFYPQKRYKFLTDFVTFFEQKVVRPPGIGLCFINEILRSSSYMIKSLKIQNYIKFYHTIKDDSIELQSTAY